MMTLKTTILAIAISMSILPIQHRIINMPVEYTNAPEISHYVTPNDTGTLIEQIMPVEEMATVEETAPVEQPTLVGEITLIEQAALPIQTINENKTYEQCMQEAFEQTYEMANKMLNDMVDSASA